MTILERLKAGRLYFDGGMGTLLQKAGLPSGELPETWNLSHPEAVCEIHLAYLNAGSQVITSNTFGANCLKFEDPAPVIHAAFDAMQRAKEAFSGDRSAVYLAFDMGPLGRMLEPLGDLEFEDAVACFAKSVRAAADCGFDLILIETMSDLLETKAAILAAKENSDLPVIVTNAYDENGRLLTGADVPAVVATLEGLGVDALGANCSLGPEQMTEIAKQYIACASLPVVINPNAGLPRVENGKTVFDVDASAFAEAMRKIASLGVCGLGGCCGTTPDFIRAVIQKTCDLPLLPPVKKDATVVASYTRAVTIGEKPIIIGERINPTGKPKLKAALREGNMGYLLREALLQQESGADVLDVNVGLAEIDETALLPLAVREIQSVTDLPLQIDTVRKEALEAALRVYNGKPLINSVNAKKESMATVFPLAKKYGGVLIALTIGEEGIPETAEGRFALAEAIVREAEVYGIDKKDIVVDPLCMAVSSSDAAARVTLDAVRMIRQRLGVKTCLGVSNVSFALPEREQINAAFLLLALENGLNCAIMNPCSETMMRAFRSFLMLNGQDSHCEDYIAFALAHPVSAAKQTPASPVANADEPELPKLTYEVFRGLADEAKRAAKTLLESEDALTLINERIVPALNLAGERFEAKTLFLPQLLLCAEAANAAFSVAASAMPRSDAARHKIVLATVQGDIHDIGKNIVKVLLQSYGFEVLDLGKDVAPAIVLEKTKQSGAKLVGLSALMTTTLDSMEQTVSLLRRELPEIRIMVGGAVLTKRYAEKIGADAYAKDAMEGVRYAQTVFEAEPIC